MKYQNLRNGAVIDSPCDIYGDDWVKLDGKAVIVPKRAEPQVVSRQQLPEGEVAPAQQEDDEDSDLDVPDIPVRKGRKR